MILKSYLEPHKYIGWLITNISLLAHMSPKLADIKKRLEENRKKMLRVIYNKFQVKVTAKVALCDLGQYKLIVNH